MASGKEMALALILSMKDQMTKQMSGPIGSLQSLGKTAASVGGTALKGIGAISGAVFGLAASSANVEMVERTFNNLAASIGTTGDAMLAQLRPATSGVLSDFQLMSGGAKLMSMGLANSTDEAAKLATMATTLGMAMGEDAGVALENFTLMLANQSIPRLDTFGISSGKVRTRIEELMGSVEGMTREQAFMTAVMEEGETAMRRVGSVTDGAAIGMAQLKATMMNLKDGIGQAVLPILVALLKPLSELAQQVGPAIIPVVERIVAAFTSLSPQVQSIIAGVMALTAAFTGASAMAGLLGPMIPGIGAALTALTGPIGIIVAAIAALGIAWATNFMGMRDALTNLWTNTLEPIFESIKAGIANMAEKFQLIDWGNLADTPWHKIFPPWLAETILFISNSIETLSRAFSSGNWGALAYQMGTILNGIWGNLANAATTWAGGAAGWFHAVINAGIGELKDKVDEWKAKIGPVISSFWGKLKDAASDWYTAVKDFWNGTIVPALAGLADKVPGWVESFKGTVTTFWASLKSQVAVWYEAVKEFWSDTISPALAGLVEKVPGWVESFKVTVTSFWDTVKTNAPLWAETVKTFLSDTISQGLTLLSGSIDPLAGSLTSVMGSIIGALNTFAESNKDTWAGDLAAKLSAMIKAALDYVQREGPTYALQLKVIIAQMQRDGIIGYIKNETSQWASEIGAAWEMLLKAGAEAVQPANLVASIGDAISGMFDEIANKLEEFANTRAEDIGKILVDFFAGVILTAIKTFWTAPDAQSAITEGGAGLVKFLESMVGAVTKAEASLGNIFIAMGKILWGIIKGGFTETFKLIGEGAQLLKTWIMGVLNQTAANFVDVVEKAKGLGAQIIDGLKEGIIERAQAVVDSIIAAINGIISSIKDSLGIKSPSTVFYAIGKDAMAGLSNGLMDGAMTGAQSVAAMLDDIAKLILMVVDRFWTVGGEDNLERARMVAQTMESIASMFMRAIEAFAKLGESTEFAGLSKGVIAMLKELDAGMSYLVEMAKRWMVPDVEKAVQIASAIQTIVGVIIPAIEALKALGEYVAQADLPERVKLFIDDLNQAIKIMVEVGSKWGEELQQALDTAPIVRIVAEAIKPAVDAVLALAEYVPTGTIAAKIEAFIDDLNQAIMAIVEVGGKWAEELEQALETAPAITAVANAIKPAVDALVALGNYTAAKDLKGIWLQFQADLQMVIRWMIGIAKLFDVEGVEAAVAFSASAGKVTSVLKGAVDGLTALGTYQHKVGLRAIWITFQTDLQMVVRWMNDIAKKFDPEGTEAAAKFASSAGAIAGVLKNAVDGLSALGEYHHKVGLKGVWVSFQSDLQMVVRWMVAIAEKFEIEGMQAAAKFSETAGKILSPIKGAIDAIKGISEYVGVEDLQARLADFVYDLGQVIYQFGKMAADFDIKGVEATAKFSEAVGKVMGGMKTALEALGKLAEFSTQYITPEKFYVFGDIVRFAVLMIEWIAYAVGPVAVKAAQDFAVQAQAVFEMMQAALDFLGDLATTALPTKDKVSQFIAILRQILAEFQVGAQVAYGIAMNAWNIGNQLAYAAAATGMGGKLLLGLPDLPKPSLPWPGIVGMPVVGGGGGGGGGAGGTGEWQQAIIDIRDMYKEDRVKRGNLATRDAVLEGLAELMPDINRRAGRS